MSYSAVKVLWYQKFVIAPDLVVEELIKTEKIIDVDWL